jgi:hypothetical protein
MRAIRIIRDALSLLGVVWLCVLIYKETKSVMTFSFPWVWEEKGRAVSPSGECELVSYEGDRGAMSSSAYVSFLVKPGDKVDPNNCDYYEAVLSTSHVLPKVRWEDKNHLVINTEGGYVTHERPYSREFKVTIEFQNEPLSSQWSEP